MPTDPVYGEVEILTPAEQQTKGLTPPGPLGASPQVPTFAGPIQPSFLERLKQEGPGLLGMAATMAIPGGAAARPLIGPLLRTGIGALTAGGAQKALGGSFTEEAGKFALSQGAMEGLFGVGRLGLGQMRAKQALEKAATEFQAVTKQYEQATVQAKTQYETDLKTHANIVTKNEAAFAQRSQTHAEKGAASIMDAWKAEVPAFKDFPSNEHGIIDVIAGRGPAALSKNYDSALKEVVQAGRGIQVPLLAEDAALLKVKSQGYLDQKDLTRVMVDAGELAQKAVGSWKGPGGQGLYRRAFNALDQVNLGNEAARGEYKTGMSLIDFGTKSKMIAKGYFDPEAARLALFDPKKVDALRKRGEGDVFRGPLAEAVQETPQPAQGPLGAFLPKPEKPSPLAPPEKPDIGIKRSAVSPMTRFHLGGATGMAGSALSGGGLHGGWPYIGGGLAGQAILPGHVYTGPGVPNPVTPPMLPSTIAEMLRAALTQRSPLTPSPPSTE